MGWSGLAAMSEDDILVTEGLSKSFGDFSAVSDVNLRVRRGSIHALIGPNGAGKTTCFNMLTKFIAPTAGTDHLQRPRHHRRRARPTWRGSGSSARSRFRPSFPHLTALENVRVALQRKRGDSFDFWRSKSAA